jgi:site-specific DNA recombinase
MRVKVLSADTAFRRAYLRTVIDKVEVDDTEIRILGRRDVIERLVMGGETAQTGVPGFVLDWRARRDSNS